MIDPLHSLAFSIQANPGIYAILIGSGVSRSAQIPTGWEITLDLVRKLAKVSAEDCGSDPASWYHERYHKEPDYADLLDELAKTPAERQQLVRGYLEPSESERIEGLKAPTLAHRAIANLVAKGYIRVIITTNFDRLMETALADAGVVPILLSSQDQVLGALPLIHTSCCVFKVHGDYLDPRIRNTPTELESYCKEFDALLDQIFNEFGLIICGWSAEWDTALRNAIERSVSRRFSHFWAIHGNLGNAAKQLIEHRQAQTLQISDADTFFSELTRLVESLEEFSRPHPLSTEAAVASLKRYLAEYKDRIRFDELVQNEVNRFLEATSSPEFSVLGAPYPDSTSVTARVRALEATCETLIAMAVVGGYWAEDWHYATWQQILRRLATPLETDGYTIWLELQRYPATLLFYALGLTAVEAGERGLMFIGKMFGTPVYNRHQEVETLVELLPPFCLFRRNEAKILQGMERHRVPLNDWLFQLFQLKFKDTVFSESKFIHNFDKFEILISLSYMYHTSQKANEFTDWAPIGCYGYRKDSYKQVLKDISSSLENFEDKSPYVKSGIFGISYSECILVTQNFSTWVSDATTSW